MFSSLAVIRNRLAQWICLTILVFVAMAGWGQGAGAATDGRWLGALLSGPEAALTQPLAWRAVLSEPVARTPATAETRARVIEAFGRAPLHFEPNRGQAAEPVKFLARTPGYQLLLTPAEAVLALHGRGATPPAMVRMQLVGEGVNRAPVVEALEALPGHSNYYLGNDPQRWQTEVPHFAKVRYSQAYPGVDWVLYGNPRQLEYDFVVAPGTDPAQIAVRFAGADALRVEANGELVVSVAGRTVLHSSPTIYQNVNGEKREVSGRYVLRESADAAPVVGFEVASYDPKLPLVIDPVVYFTFVGGAPDDNTGVGGDDYGYGVAVDSAGYTYITGSTSTNNAKIASLVKQFPITSIYINNGFSGGTDAFVTRMDAAGTIIYSTYFGGSAFDVGYGIAVGSGGNAYITGSTNSDDFPIRTSAALVNEGTTVKITTGSPLDDAKPGTNYTKQLVATGGQCAIVPPATTCTVVYTWSLDPTTLANLPASLTLSSVGTLSGNPASADIGTYNFIVNVVDNASTPNTARKTFTLTVVGSALQGTQDAFIARINANGKLGYSKYLGGTGNEAGYGIAVDTLGQAYVTGYTNSANAGVNPVNNFPGANFSAVTPRPSAVGEDAFVVKVNAAGSGLLYSRLTGFAGNDRGQGIVLDAAVANVYITGFRTNAANEAAFVVKVNNTGAISYDAALDGNGNERGLAIDRDNNSGVYITGYTTSTSSITTPGAYDTVFNGPAASQDAFVAKYTDTGASFNKAYATYLGGYSNDVGYSIAVDSFGNAYIAGGTFSPNFPMVSPDDGSQVKGEAFLSRFNDAGTQLTYSSFWGGEENDSGRGLAKDFANDVYLVGYTNSPKAGFQLGSITPYRDYSGGADAFVTKFSIPIVNTDYSLSVNLQGSGSGLVTGIPEGIGQSAPCQLINGVLIPNADCNASYPTGTIATLTAVPTTGSLFVSWSGSGSGGCAGTTTLTCAVTMDATKAVVATFSKAYRLTVSSVGGGTVTSNPAGIACGVDCTEDYPLNTPVALTAVPNADSVFVRWTGACSGAVATCVVTMGSAQTVAAEFAPTQYSLNVTKVGSGTVTSVPDGINCGTDCTESYAPNAVVTLTATALSGAAFVSWADACASAGTNPTCAVTMDAARSVTAYFSPTQTLKVSKAGNASGVVKSTPAGIDCGSSCQASYFRNTSVTLTATPTGNATFAGWSGACAGTGACTVVLSTDKVVTATFTVPVQSFTLTVVKSGTGIGTVNSNPNGISCGSTCKASYAEGTAVTLTAIPDADSTFTGWSGACIGTGACAVVMSANQNVVASFTRIDTNLPDLVIPTLTSPGLSANGQRNVSFALTVKNQGAKAAGAFRVGLYFTTDRTVVPAVDINAGKECSFTSLAINATATCSGNIVLPSTLPAGTYYLGAYADPSGSIKELRKDNNAAVSNTVNGTLTPKTFTVYRLTTVINRPGNGTVYSQPSGIACSVSTNCQAPFLAGDKVALAAIPAAGFVFAGWSGACTGTGVCNLTMSAARTVIANFSAKKAQTIGLYAPTTARFYLRNSNISGAANLFFGYGPANVGWKPLAGDWDGNGTQTIGVYNPTTGVFSLRNSNSAGAANMTFVYRPAGVNATWLPLVGDWDGNRTQTVGLYNPATGQFLLRNSNSAGAANVTFVYRPAGVNATWLPLVGDWDGNRTQTVGLYNPATGVFLLRNSNSAGAANLAFVYRPTGATNRWLPVIGDWDGNGTQTIGLYDPAASRFHLRNGNNAGKADLAFVYGAANAGWKPLIGDWNGPAF